MFNLVLWNMVIMLFSNNVQAMTDATTDSSSDAVVILSVSTVLGQENSYPTGSMMGGTILYMKVSGLDQTASNNAVYIGKYPCVISDKGVNGLFMNCRTTKPDADDTNLSKLQIVVRVSGKADSVCTFSGTYCQYTYSNYYTPQLFYVTPRSNYPRQLSYWRAKWAVTSNVVQQLNGQFIGSNRCDRFSIQDDYPDEISFWDDIVVCQVSAEIQAGYYPYSIYSQVGNQTNDVGVKQKKVYSDETYDSKILPLISSINTNFASPQGQILQINGYGFSPIASKNIVKISGQSATIKVISSTPTQILAKVPILDSLPSSSALTTSTLYIQGSGLFYTRYDLSSKTTLNGNCGSFRTQLLNDPDQLTQFIIADGIYPEPDVQNTFGTYYGQYFRGFLKAPITGNYKFYLASDDCASFFINTQATLQATSSETAVASNWWNPYRNYWYEDLLYPTKTPKSISENILLQEGQYYYVELFHTQTSSSGYLTLSMEIENTSGPRKSNSLNRLYSITTSYTPVKEVIEFTLYNSNGNTPLTGTYQLQFTYGVKSTPQTGIYYNYITEQLSPTASASTIESAIQNCGGSYLVSVTATKVDSTGAALADSVTAYAGYKYIITFDSHRGQVEYRTVPKLLSSLTGGTVFKNIQNTQEPVDPISGNLEIKMNIGGIDNFFQVADLDYALPYNVAASVLADNIQRITGVRPWVWTEGRAQDGWTWRIKFRSYVKDLVEIIATKTTLTSGNGAVTVTVENTVQESNNLLFEPIPNELLFTYSTAPQVQVITNDILAGCEQATACDFTLGDTRTPTLTAYSVTGSVLSLTLQAGTDLPSIKSTDLEISFLGADCSDIKVTNAQSPFTITCNLEQLDGQNIQEAGSNQIPVVHNVNIGYSLVSGTVTGQDIGLTITSVTPNSASPDGGTTVTITGTGFPKNLERVYTLTIGGQPATPISITNQQIVVITPTLPNGEIILVFNSKTVTDSSSFTVDASKRITLESLEHNTMSPTYRGLFTITGTNFGTSKDDITVKLINTEKTYDAKTVSVSDTQIVVYLRGGMPGTYTVVVTRKNYGRSYAANNANQFQYIIPVTSVTLADGTSPAKGSEAGGQVIKITGSNFVQGSTIVFIGKAINWICEIDETRFTSSEIYCTVPAKNEYYNNDPQEVVVTLDITLESTCTAADANNCRFTYDSSLNPTISAYPANSVPSTGSRILTEQDQQKPDYQKLVTRKRYLWTEQSKEKGINHILNHGKSERRDMLSSVDLVLSNMKTYAPGDTETLTGTGLTSAVNVVFVGPITKSIVATVNTDTITYTIPELPQGQYTTYIQTQNGYADKIWLTVIELKIVSIPVAAIGGQLLIITGHGFNAKQSPIVKVGSTICTNLQIVSSTQATCRMARQSGTGQNVVISQLPSENNSATPISSQFWLGLTGTTTAPVFTAVTVNGANTYDSIKKVYTASAGNVVLVITGQRLTGTTQVVTLEYQSNSIVGVLSAQSATSITATFNNLPAGVYSINIQLDGAYAYNSDVTKQALIVSASLPTSSNPTVSYAGGASVTFTGSGFDTNKQYNQVSLCGFDCPITSSTFNSITCEAPKVVTPSVLTQYTALQEAARYIKASEVTLTADSTTNVANFFDLLQSTYYTSAAAANCFVQVDFGTSRVLKLHQLRYVPRIDKLAISLKDAVFQYTLDGSTWVNLLTVDQTVHTGWNIYVPAADISGIKAIRLFDSRGSSGSSCQLAEIELKGWIYSSSTNAYNVPTPCSAAITVNGQSIGTVSNAASYSSSSVPVVNTVSPLSGRFTEEAVITIAGTGFVSGQTTVTIDGVVCTIQTVSSTQVVCKTGIKDLGQNMLNGVFQVRVNGNLAVNNQQFIYATKWSDINTWGGYVFPGDGDSVIVNMGQTLIVDVKTPKLMQVLVEGTLTFSDEVDTSMDAHFIVIREGKFNIGTETTPHLHKVQITLHGVETDTQMPAMGNKVLGCHQCQLTIHGEERTPTWTLLSSTVQAGATQITLDDAVDWRVGEQIVITSSQVEHMQSEKRYITAVSVDKKTLTLDQPLTYKHYSEVETYGTEQFPMKVEVGLLTRNIVIQGEESDVKYGYHLMIHGRAEKGSIGKISYAEFRYGGQPRIIGRYPIHFHLNGEVDESYVIGNSIHDCYARCLTIHGVHYLKVQRNVCYNTFGHAIFFEDGIETNNVVEYNLVASTKQSWIMLQTDITVATYWVTNPQNILRHNRSGGSEWYGFWYEIKNNPDGPSATSDICPPGLNILEFDDNWSHSNGRFGIRIFQLAPRQFPCKDVANWTNPDPYIDNPSLQAVFSNFYTWKNNECGILAEEMGNVLMKNIMIADSKFAGVQAHKGNSSAEGSVLDNALIIGKSNGNANSDDYYDGSRALVVPRTNGFLAKNIRLYNFGSNTALIESCSVCWNIKLWVQGGKNTQFQNIVTHNSDTANRIFWQKHRREIFWDIDGTISNTPGGAYIIPYKKHIDGIPGCTTHPEAFWDNSIICAMNQVTIRDVLVNSPVPVQDFQGVDMKLFRLDSSNVAVKMDQTIDENKYIHGETMMKIKKSHDVVNSFASVFATGYTYNVHFKFGASDPLSMGVFASPYFTPNDKAIIFRFNYSANRETFDIYRHIGDTFPLNYTKVAAIPDTNTCNQGDWYNDRANKLFFLCLSGKNKMKYEYVEVQAVICRDECSSLGDVAQEDGYRYWSSPDTWVDGKVPVEGDSPIVQAAYQVILDVDPPKLANLTVLGSLIFDERRASTTLQAERIWVRSGKLLAGNATNPFPGKINIILNGEFGDNPLVIDAGIDVGNKVLAVTKGIELYSTPPGTVWTRLTAYADAGATQVSVAQCADWKVGDEIVFGPSGSDPEQREKRTITALSGCSITLNQALEFDHYGAPSVTINKGGVGSLDMRAVVGHLTRKIKIEGGPSVHGLGCRVLIYYFTEPEEQIPRKGYAILHGVEFNNCGQYDTQRSGLDFRNLNSELVKTPSEVVGCSFHDTTGMLMTIQNSQYITILNNIFFTGIKALVQINNSQYIKFQNNALIYVKKRVLAESFIANWAVLGNFVYEGETVPTRMIRDIVDISGNVGQGSQDTGFFIMASGCADAYQTSFYNNECSASVLACFGARQSSGQCDYLQGLSAYHSGVGIMYAINSAESKLDNSLVAENAEGIVLRRGTDSIQDNVIYFTNSYVTAFARPECPKCYSTQLNPQCSQAYGVKMGTLSTSASPPISTKPSDAFDSICTIQRVDLRVYIKNVEFNSFRLTHDTVPQCGKNSVFRTNFKAHDMTGQHYLVNSPCTNCEFDSILYKMRDSDWHKLGWFGGCGSFECTGQKNVLIEDQTGEFFGQIGQAITNNTYFGPNVTHCIRKDSWNGYWCPERKITVLNFMSIAPDFNKRLYSPIKLTDGLFFNEINSFFEWNWDGPEPLNLRESKFVSLVSVNSVINMTNAGMNPTDSEYWLSKRYESGSPEDFVILKWQFSVPQIIQVTVNNKVVQPGITVKNKHYDLTTMTNICGANNYFYENRTIHFVVNAQLGCKVRISLKNTLQVSTRLAITTDEFFGDKFLQYAVAQIGGDPYNYFIIGTKKSTRRFLGETVTTELIVDWGIVDSAVIGVDDATQSQSNLAGLATKLESFTLPAEVGSILGHSSTIAALKDLNFPSTEATQATPTTTTNGGQTGSNTGTGGSTTGNTGTTTGNNNNNSTTQTDSDELELVTDEGVNQLDTTGSDTTNTNSGTIQKAIKKSESSSDTVVIVVAVICSVVGVSIIISGLLYYKKVKLAKLMAERAQKIDNEFFKVNITEQQMQQPELQHHE